MENNKFITQSLVPKTETRIILNQGQQKPKLSPAAKSKIIKK